MWKTLLIKNILSFHILSMNIFFEFCSELDKLIFQTETLFLILIMEQMNLKFKVLERNQ